jgi:hypothetical protein
MNFLRRFASWVVAKGSIAPFDRIPSVDVTGGEKLAEPFRRSVWVQAAMRRVILPVTSVPLQWCVESDDGPQMVADPAQAAFWAQPAVGPGGQRLSLTDVIEMSLGWLMLDGEFFWIMDGAPVPFPEVGAAVRPFAIARPDRMRAIIDRGQLTAWAFTDATRRTVLLDPAQVIHVKNWNPYSDWRGLGQYEAAQIAAEADYLAGRFNLNLMKNNGDTGPIIIGKSGMPDDAQQKQITLLLREKKERSLRGEFRPVFLGGDIVVEDAKVQVPDAAFVNVRLQNRHEVFIAFGVPPSMADIQASYSIGSASDRYALITETCVPVSEKFLAAVNAVNARGGDATRRAVFAWDKHPVMVAARNERIDAGTKLWDRGMPWAEVNHYLDLRLPEFDGWDTGFLPFSVAPVSTLPPPADPAAAPDYAEPADEDAEESAGPVAAMLRALRGGAVQKARDPREVAQWRTLIAKRRAATLTLQAKINKVLFNARAEVLRRLESAPARVAVSARAGVAADMMFKLPDFRAALGVAMRGTLRPVLDAAGKELFAEIGKDDPFKFPDPKALEFLRGRENKLSDTATDIYEQVKGSLQEGLNGGETTAQLAARVRGEFNDMSRERSMRIAMTEVNSAYGEARQEAMKQGNVQFKKWLTSGNDNVRPAHQEANTQTVPVDEPFDVGGEQLMHPGDPNGSPENVINCHCVSIAVATKEEES